MNEEPLDEVYLRWLYRQVVKTRTRVRARTYWSFLRKLYSTEFVWLVSNDDNRLMDGVALRSEFLQDSLIEDVDPAWMALGCSFLEMLVALSRRLSFEDGGETPTWFWQLIHNIDLDGITDAIYPEYNEGDITEKLENVIFRRYMPNGEGGLFPLREPQSDQRGVELWYQMNAYLIENS